MRRLTFIAIAATLSACATPSAPPPRIDSRTLAPADAATGLAVGPLAAYWITPARTAEGVDPVVTLRLVVTDGRVLTFQQANHANDDLLAQAPGGPLAQAMGFFGEESPTLYHRAPADVDGAPFLCGEEGPGSIGYFRADDGAIAIVGLKSAFEFQTHANGTTTPVPYSPDQVCARLRYTESAPGN